VESAEKVQNCGATGQSGSITVLRGPGEQPGWAEMNPRTISTPNVLAPDPGCSPAEPSDAQRLCGTNRRNDQPRPVPPFAQQSDDPFDIHNQRRQQVLHLGPPAPPIAGPTPTVVANDRGQLPLDLGVLRAHGCVFRTPAAFPRRQIFRFVVVLEHLTPISLGQAGHTLRQQRARRALPAAKVEAPPVAALMAIAAPGFLSPRTMQHHPCAVQQEVRRLEEAPRLGRPVPDRHRP
jgi:hypothetical protein